jgi:hypothetical protein
MHAQIASFPSSTMYANKLKSHERVAGHLLRDLPNAAAPTEEDAKDLLGTPVVFFDTAGCEYFERVDGDAEEGSRCNENEVTVVKNWVDSLVSQLRSGVVPTSIDGRPSSPGLGWNSSLANCCHYTVCNQFQHFHPSSQSLDTKHKLHYCRPFSALSTELTLRLDPWMVCKVAKRTLSSSHSYGVMIRFVSLFDDGIILTHLVFKREVGFLKEKRRLNGDVNRSCAFVPPLNVTHSGYDAGEAQSLHSWRLGNR